MEKMDPKTVSKDMERIASLIAGWVGKARVDALERDLVLEKLRRVYEEISSAGEISGDAVSQDNGKSMESVEPESEPEVLPIDFTFLGESQQEESGVVMENEVEQLVRTDKTGSEAQESEELHSEIESKGTNSPIASSPDGVGDMDSKTVSDISIAESSVHPAADVGGRTDGCPMSVGTDSEKMTPSGQNSWVGERKRIDKRVIRSLYGEDEEVEREQNGSSDTTIDEPKVPQSPIAASSSDPDQVKPKKVLGEVIAAGGIVLGETIASPVTDIAERISSNNVSSLKKAIGINDKFLMQHELFGDDSEAYASAIERLDACASLEEAMLYIYDHYDWNPDCDGARLLSELLVRKFK